MTAITCQAGDRIRVRILGGQFEGVVVDVSPDNKITIRTAEYAYDMLVYPHEVVCKLAQPAPQEARNE
jgi:hypothetical protein